jgi:hypothetical protein
MCVFTHTVSIYHTISTVHRNVAKYDRWPTYKNGQQQHRCELWQLNEDTVRTAHTPLLLHHQSNYILFTRDPHERAKWHCVTLTWRRVITFCERHVGFTANVAEKNKQRVHLKFLLKLKKTILEILVLLCEVCEAVEFRYIGVAVKNLLQERLQGQQY